MTRKGGLGNQSHPSLDPPPACLTGTCDGHFCTAISPRDIALICPQLLLRDVREGEDAGGLLENGGGVHMCPHVGEVFTGVGGGGTVEGEVVTQQHREGLG
ncbi:MAG: hypothetical protein A6F71_08855 [Cycloclasticus sp. symbiont of Poecilosclerida sp. M]|nr:MAG: hypothetical protein A6F71_08855 [Cycloclasticus sp. symbiont of Poecilosclerida sp. M]